MSEYRNSEGTVFKPIPMKNNPLSGEYWVEVTKANGTVLGIGQFDDSFKGLSEAEAWIKINMENPKFL